MTRALKQVRGVTDVSVDLLNRQAVVEHDGASVEAMDEAVDDAGYKVVAHA